MPKLEVNARGLSAEELQAAIDTYIESKKPTYLPRLEQELQQIAEKRKELEKQLKQLEEYQIVAGIVADKA